VKITLHTGDDLAVVGQPLGETLGAVAGGEVVMRTGEDRVRTVAQPDERTRERRRTLAVRGCDGCDIEHPLAHEGNSCTR